MISATTRLTTEQKEELVRGFNPKSEEEHDLLRWMVDMVDMDDSGADPFPIAFEEAWKRLGCSRGDNAKTKLHKLSGIEEGVDYKVRRTVHQGQYKGKVTEKVLLRSTQGQMFQLPSGSEQLEPWECLHHKSYKEEIFLTRNVFRRFAMSLNNPRAEVLIKYAVQIWEHRDVVINAYTNLETERIKAAEMQTRVVKELESLPPPKKRKHDAVCVRLAKRLCGMREVAFQGGRVDVVTSTEAIEVKPLKEWTHGVGQAIYYGTILGLKPRLHIFDVDTNSIAYQHARLICNKVGLDLSFECSLVVQERSNVPAYPLRLRGTGTLGMPASQELQGGDLPHRGDL